MEGLLAVAIGRQLGATIDMLENAIRACPDGFWSDPSDPPEVWYLAFHTLFFLDFYLSESTEGFAPPPPFGLEELDPAGVMPPRVYTKRELLDYLAHGREKARRVIATLTEERAREPRRFGRVEGTLVESLVSSLRHVQHHVAQIHLLLRRRAASVPPWVGVSPLG